MRKAVKLDILHRNNIKYTEHSIGEEALYSFQTLYAAEKIDFLDEKPVYFYVNHAGSLSRSKELDPWGSVAESLATYLKSCGLYQKYADTINAFRATATVVAIDKMNQFLDKGEKQKRIKDRVQKFRECYDLSYGIDISSMSMKARVFVPFLRQGFCFPIIACSNLRRMFSRK